LGAKNIAFFVDGFTAEFTQQALGVTAVGDKPFAFDVGVILADEPGLRTPGTATPLAAESLQMAGLADVVITECHKLLLGPYHYAEIFTSALRPWFSPTAAFGLSSGVLPRTHALPGGLGLLDIFSCGLALLGCCHISLLYRLYRCI
jgi:hypothetical protein